jgi:hypothetical protein
LKGNKGDRGLPGLNGDNGPQGVHGLQLSEDVINMHFSPFKGILEKVMQLEDNTTVDIMNMSSALAEALVELKGILYQQRSRLQERSNTPVAHLYVSSRGRQYISGLMTYWTTGNSLSVLAGGMTYSSGYITVPEDGLYYVYLLLRVYYRSSSYYQSQVYITVNGNNVLYSYCDVYRYGNERTDYRSQYLGGVQALRNGDRLAVYTSGAMYYYLYTQYNYFGAFKLTG